LAVLGFVELAELRAEPAEGTFKRAVAADPGLSLARLGLGLAQIRRGKLAAGREELQTAVILDPGDALLRSYLGKAYYEEKRSREARKELDAAKRLDPSDPTPWLYAALLEQNENRPVEALYELRQSIERNDQRAVYRSRLLLDEDRAVRSSDLARVYNDLGFEQLGLVTARRSADEDQANYSSHLFLAGNYRNVPEFAPAFLSETLQGRIYQPVGVNAVRPDVVNESVSFNEYTALFDRERVRGFGAASYAETGTFAPSPADVCLDPSSDPNNPSFIPCSDLAVHDSHGPAGELIGTINRDRYSAALSYQKSTDDGFRFNNDQDQANYRGFFAWSPSYRDTVQLNLLHGSRETGDLPLRETPLAHSLERIDTDLTNLAVGYHRAMGPGADLAISAIYNKTEQTGTRLDIDTSTKATLDGPQLEGQYVLRQEHRTWVFGAGHFDGKQTLESPGAPQLSGDDAFTNGYAYLKLRDLGPVELTVGAAVERVVAPSGFFPARDAPIPAAEVEFSETRLSPKVGMSAYLGSKTALRAAAFYRLSPALGRLQTLEPTQLAGFNQFFDEPGGTRSLSYGVGVDHEFTPHLYGGVYLQRRARTVPEASCDAPDPDQGCLFQTPTHVEGKDSRDLIGSLYLSAPIGRRFSVGIEYSDQRRAFDFLQMTTAGTFEDEVRTKRLRPRASVYFPFGLFATVSATRYDQEVEQFDDMDPQFAARTTVDSTFWTQDVQLGYRLPKRWGTILLDARNVSDREYTFYLSAAEETVIPARRVTLSVQFAY
ncbi:MAG TPA: tetratricopeptide repeat protein, partial [Candidatus Polarisedimenticolaceae bacterium]|nr:tetratricopeptide repeat protein [Candidatus Polarisedimenticolaceae bacterium]